MSLKKLIGIIYLLFNSKNTVAIYGIRRLNSKRYVYVGQTSRHIEERWARHIQDAYKGKHVNDKLAQFIKDNKGLIILDILEFTSNKNKLKREKYWINKLRKEKYKLFNQV